MSTHQDADATVMAVTFAKTIAKIAEFAVELAESLHKDLGLEYSGPTPVAAKKVGKKRARIEKDPNEPKRPVTSYMLYSAFLRDDAKSKGEAMPAMKEIADMWNKLDEHEKEKYNKEAQAQKDIYDKQMIDFKAGRISGVTHKTESGESASGSDDEDVPPPKMTHV